MYSKTVFSNLKKKTKMPSFVSLEPSKKMSWKSFFIIKKYSAKSSPISVSVEFLVKMVSLPPDRNKHGVMHYLHKNSEFVPTKEVPRRSIHLKHCSNWSEHKIIEQPEPKVTNFCFPNSEPTPFLEAMVL